MTVNVQVKLSIEIVLKKCARNSAHKNCTYSYHHQHIEWNQSPGLRVPLSSAHSDCLLPPAQKKIGGWKPEVSVKKNITWTAMENKPKVPGSSVFWRRLRRLIQRITLYLSQKVTFSRHMHDPNWRKEIRPKLALGGITAAKLSVSWSRSWVIVHHWMTIKMKVRVL
jgi:hypothetical protein